MEQRIVNCKSRNTETETKSTHLSQLFKSGWLNTFFLECDMTVFDNLLYDLVVYGALGLTRLLASAPLSLCC